MPWWSTGYDPEARSDDGRPLTFAYRVVVSEGWIPSQPVEATYHSVCPVCGYREEHSEGLADGNELPVEIQAVCTTSLREQQVRVFAIRLIAARLENRLPAEPRHLKRPAEAAPASTVAAARLPHAALDDRLRRSRSSTVQTALALGYSDTAPLSRHHSPRPRLEPMEPSTPPRRDPGIVGIIASDIPSKTRRPGTYDPNDPDGRPAG